MKSVVLGALGSSLVLLAAGHANAAVEPLEHVTNASSICQGVRPEDKAQFESAALELRHTGPEAAFVNCSFLTLMDQGNGGDVGLYPVRYFGAFFTNLGSAPATVSCTGIQGVANFGTRVYESLSVEVPPDASPEGGGGYIFFEPEQGEPLFYQTVSMTCIVPAGVGIADTYLGFNMDDAASP